MARGGAGSRRTSSAGGRAPLRPGPRAARVGLHVAPTALPAAGAPVRWRVRAATARPPRRHRPGRAPVPGVLRPAGASRACRSPAVRAQPGACFPRPRTSPRGRLRRGRNALPAVDVPRAGRGPADAIGRGADDPGRGRVPCADRRRSAWRLADDRTGYGSHPRPVSGHCDRAPEAAAHPIRRHRSRWRDGVRVPRDGGLARPLPARVAGPAGAPRHRAGLGPVRGLHGPLCTAPSGYHLFTRPRIGALYRQWRAAGDAAFEPLRSTAAVDAIADGRGRVAWLTLAHDYDHLVPLAGADEGSARDKGALEEEHVLAHRLNPGSQPRADLHRSAISPVRRPPEHQGRDHARPALVTRRGEAPAGRRPRDEHLAARLRRATDARPDHRRPGTVLPPERDAARPEQARGLGHPHHRHPRSHDAGQREPSPSRSRERSERWAKAGAPTTLARGCGLDPHAVARPSRRLRDGRSLGVHRSPRRSRHSAGPPGLGPRTNRARSSRNIS